MLEQMIISIYLLGVIACSILYMNIMSCDLNFKGFLFSISWPLVLIALFAVAIFSTSLMLSKRHREFYKGWIDNGTGKDTKKD